MNPTLMQDLAATIAADRRREAERFRAAAPGRSGWGRRLAALVSRPAGGARTAEPVVGSPSPCGPSASSASRAR
jgi:hypothetical protein